MTSRASEPRVVWRKLASGRLDTRRTPHGPSDHSKGFGALPVDNLLSLPAPRASQCLYQTHWPVFQGQWAAVRSCAPPLPQTPHRYCRVRWLLQREGACLPCGRGRDPLVWGARQRHPAVLSLRAPVPGCILYLLPASEGFSRFGDTLFLGLGNAGKASKFSFRFPLSLATSRPGGGGSRVPRCLLSKEVLPQLPTA